jgi:hypothetical protein
MVAVTRREIQGQVIFLYANDMNSASTERTVRNILATSNPDFFPASAKWVTCQNYTYLPHSNECGIRTLLALTLQAMHPNLSENILLPIMHHNLAQIGRAWITLSLLNSDISLGPVQWAFSATGYSSMSSSQ